MGYGDLHERCDSAKGLLKTQPSASHPGVANGLRDGGMRKGMTASASRRRPAGGCAWVRARVRGCVARAPGGEICRVAVKVAIGGLWMEWHELDIVCTRGAAPDGRPRRDTPCERGWRSYK